MKFWIITPTCNRYKLLKRAIKSVLQQGYNDFELIIIDDSTNNETYNNINIDFKDKRIKYLKNNKNSWVNFSRNRWLDNLSNDVDYVMFLDDDDYLSWETLFTANKVIIKNKNINWFLSNKKNITKLNNYNLSYNYFDDYLFWNKINWDSTHCISKSAIWKIRFSKIIKQAQEWLFFIELWEKNNIFTYNYDSIISEYLEWWLSDYNTKVKNIFIKILSVFEFIFIRKVSFHLKIKFIKRVLWI